MKDKSIQEKRDENIRNKTKDKNKTADVKQRSTSTTCIRVSLLGAPRCQSGVFDSEDTEKLENLLIRWEARPRETERKRRMSRRKARESDLDDTQTTSGGKHHSRAFARPAMVCAVIDSQDTEKLENLKMMSDF